jgi:hypothetical protein
MASLLSRDAIISFEGIGVISGAFKTDSFTVGEPDRVVGSLRLVLDRKFYHAPSRKPGQKPSANLNLWSIWIPQP